MKRISRLLALLVCSGWIWTAGASAQITIPAPNAGFDITGFIQEATLNAAPRTTADPALRGGTITVNGRVILIPDNLIVQFPASSWTWPQLFDSTAWAPVYDAAITPVPVNAPPPPAGDTGLALRDPLVNHFPSYEVRVVGNIRTDEVTGRQVYIAALIVPLSQQGLNAQSGYINYIDYATGRFRVGGTLNDPNTGTLCEINDPTGRFGLQHSPDQRFSADTSNPTITAATGYPVCIARVAPPGIDPLCPSTNRPLVGGVPSKAFTMPASAAPGTTTPDPYEQVPLMPGDWVSVSGTLFKINPTGPASLGNQYLSVHSLTAHLGIKTAPGTTPAYVRVEEFLFGVGDGNGGPTVAGIVQETSTRVQLVAFTTDSDATGVNLPTGSLFGIDARANGNEILQPFPNGNAANIVIDDPVRGRLRWQTSKNNEPVGNQTGPGKFYREYILFLSTGQTPNVANGLTAGQYRLPVFEYIFGEGVNFGEPVPPFNFNDFGFLTTGNGPFGGPGGPVIGRLTPFPLFQ